MKQMVKYIWAVHMRHLCHGIHGNMAKPDSALFLNGTYIPTTLRSEHVFFLILQILDVSVIFVMHSTEKPKTDEGEAAPVTDAV